MSLLIYSLAWYAATPLVAGYLLWRALRQPAYRSHWSERWSLGRVRRPAQPVIWVHAVSVGETRAAQPLLDALAARYPQAALLLTHMTPTGRQAGLELYGKRFGDRLHQAYLPYDLPWSTRRFLAGWRPAVGILIETELWPNLVRACRQADVPLALVNARLSERSLRKGQRWSGLIVPALQSVAVVAAQTEADASRIRALGRSEVAVTGNLKFDIDPVPELVERGRAWRGAFGDRPVVLAASTREGEEVLLLQAWRSAVADAESSMPLLVVVPRHPQRFEQVAQAISAAGLRFLRRSDLDRSEAWSTGVAPDAVLGDSMGEMFAWYAMADVAIIGGSLLPFGAQNLIESCAVGTPVVLGPHTFNFAEAAAQALAADAAVSVADAPAAVREAIAIAMDRPLRERRSAAARRFTEMHRGATRRTMSTLMPSLDAMASPGARR